jgi:hypothetical protein
MKDQWFSLCFASSSHAVIRSRVKGDGETTCYSRDEYAAWSCYGVIVQEVPCRKHIGRTEGSEQSLKQHKVILGDIASMESRRYLALVYTP